MYKKEINLFKAASREDKKIQTGISKGFIFTLGAIVLIIAILAYVGLMYMDIQTLRDEVKALENELAFTSGINALNNRIAQDKAALSAIQGDVNAVIAIKTYAQANSILYPGFTKAEKNELLSKSGCVPDGVISGSDSGVSVYYTNGMDSYVTISTNQYGDNIMSEVVFPKGYVLLVFAGNEENLAQQYVNNILSNSTAREAFAIEPDLDRSAITIDSFETGFFEKPSAGNPDSVYVYYVKARLKSVFQIIYEDDFLSSHLVSPPVIRYSNKSMSIELKSINVTIYEIAAYLSDLGIFNEDIGYTGESITEIPQGTQYSATLVCRLKEVR